MLKHNLTALKNAILKAPRQLNLSVIHARRKHDGFMSHGLAGWAEVLFIPKWEELWHAKPNDAIGRAANVLGLNRALTVRLITPSCWPADLYLRYAHASDRGDVLAIAMVAAERIERFIRTEGQE